MPVHGLIVLAGQPGTGKTTLARGLANQVAGAVTGSKSRFIQIDPHALTSSALGRSQKEVAKLFHQTIPEHAADGLCYVLLDEVETLAPDRQRMSFETNPADVHRATDAALAGIDLLTRKNRNVLLIDEAMDSREVPFVRYADDFLLFAADEAGAQRALDIAGSVLRGLELEQCPSDVGFRRAPAAVQRCGTQQAR